MRSLPETGVGANNEQRRPRQRSTHKRTGTGVCTPPAYIAQIPKREVGNLKAARELSKRAYLKAKPMFEAAFHRELIKYVQNRYVLNDEEAQLRGKQLELRYSKQSASPNDILLTQLYTKYFLDGTKVIQPALKKRIEGGITAIHEGVTSFPRDIHIFSVSIDYGLSRF